MMVCKHSSTLLHRSIHRHLPRRNIFVSIYLKQAKYAVCDLYNMPLSKLLVSFLKEWEYIPEFSAETWFKEKKDSYNLNPCFQFRHEAGFLNQTCCKIRIAANTPLCGVHRQEHPRDKNPPLWLIHKREKPWNHMIFNFKVLENVNNKC